MATRRHVLQALAAASLSPTLAAGCASGPDTAAAWRAPGADEQDLRLYALAHAILCPNPHNRQPWQVALEGADSLTLWPDLERLLPETDPFDRQITLGCGAFLELFDLAVRARGKTALITPWPAGEPAPRLDQRPFAHIQITDAPREKDTLFDAILTRRTNRKPFDGRTPAEADCAAIAETAAAPGLRYGWAIQGDPLQALRTLAWRGFQVEFENPPTYRESVDVMRIGAADIARHRDGLALEGPMIEFARMFGLVNRETLLDINNKMTRQGLEAWRPLAENAPAYMWMISADNSRATQIQAGRAYARLNLAATARGMAMHPWSQTLQEYAVMTPLFQEVRGMLGASGEECVQMLVRIGYGPEVRPSARRGVEPLMRPA